MKTSRCLFLFAMAIVFISIPATGQPVRSTHEILPPGILPVVILQGSDYDMGFQYGQQAAGYIAVNAEAAWASALETSTRDEVLLALKASQHYIQEYTPENIEILKGMVAGARSSGYTVTYEDVLLINCALPDPETSTYPAGAEQSELPPKKGCSVCSAWGSATKDGRLIGLDTLDGDGESRYGVIIVAFPDKGNAYICGADAGEIGDHFLMNNKGFFLGNSGGGPSREIDNNYGLGWACSLPHIVRFSDNAKEARDMIQPWQISNPENFHFVDIHGNAFVVEKTAAVQAVRKSGDFGEKDFLFSSNNYLHKTMKITKEGGFHKGHGGYGAYSAPRNFVFWDMLHNYRGRIDEAFMQMILRFPGNPPPWPPASGWNAKICRPTNSWISVVVPDDGDEGYVHICTGPAGRVIQSSTASDGSPMLSNYQYIDGTHTFFTLRLKQDPKSVVKEAKKDAKNSLAAAYKEFMQVTPKDDPSYSTLQKLYSTANVEYYRGNLAWNKARTTSGRESIAWMAKAATGYTRCQARATEVYEALVPPATSPSDLGLKPFGGDWATWETEVGSPK